MNTGQVIKYQGILWKSAQVNGFFSNEVLNLSSGNLKFVKIEPCSQFPIHIHVEKTECAVVIEGNPDITINDMHYSGRVGDVFVFPPRVKHAIGNNTSQDCVLLITSLTIDEQ